MSYARAVLANVIQRINWLILQLELDRIDADDIIEELKTIRDELDDLMEELEG